MNSTARHRFDGYILGVGTPCSRRFVVGCWQRSPFGAFADIMVAHPDGARELIAPNEEVGAYVCETYQFDQVTLSDVHVARTSSKWVIATDRSRLSATFGRRRLLGYPLRLVRGPLIHPVTARLSNPLARRLVEGVQKHGSAGHGAHEYYVAQDLRRVATLSGSWEGEPIGVLAPVTPAPQFGFSSTPQIPSLTRVTTFIDRPGA